jgi:hypothetical protein
VPTGQRGTDTIYEILRTLRLDQQVDGWIVIVLNAELTDTEPEPLARRLASRHLRAVL